MLRNLLFAAVLVLPFRAVGQAATAPTPATVKFENEMAATICRELEKENQQTAFAQLDKPAAQNVLQQVMVRAFEPRQKEATKLYKANSIDYSEVMRSVGQRVAGRLAGECPVALKLFMRLADQPTDTDVADTKITDAERPLLTKIATATCAALTKANAQKPLTQLPKAERQALVQQTMQQMMKTHATEITNQYGAEIFSDVARLRGFGIKVGLLMANTCATEVASLSAE